MSRSSFGASLIDVVTRPFRPSSRRQRPVSRTSSYPRRRRNRLVVHPLDEVPVEPGQSCRRLTSIAFCSNPCRFANASAFGRSSRPSRRRFRPSSRRASRRTRERRTDPATAVVRMDPDVDPGQVGVVVLRRSTEQSDGHTVLVPGQVGLRWCSPSRAATWSRSPRGRTASRPGSPAWPPARSGYGIRTSDLVVGRQSLDLHAHSVQQMDTYRDQFIGGGEVPR